MKKFVYVYLLHDNYIPLYVGATINTEQRIKQHLITTLKDYPNKNNVKILILETTVANLAAKIEKRWAEFYIKEGHSLLKTSKLYYRSDRTKGIDSKKYPLVSIALLAKAFNKNTQTIKRWIKTKDDRLTSDRAKSALLKLKK